MDASFIHEPRLEPLAEIPLMGFGTFIGNSESDQIQDRDEMLRLTEEAVFGALEAGYRHLDCAANYDNEEGIGKALARAFLPKDAGGLGLTREEIWITTKGSCTQHCLEGSLKRMGISYVDLYLAHFPDFFESYDTLLAAWTTMNTLLKQGIAQRIGVSNQYQEHLTRLLALCKATGLQKPYANEVEIHPVCPEEPLVRMCQDNDIRVIAYCPLGYLNNALILQNESIVKVAERLVTVTEKKVSPAQVALAWNMARGVAVIPKSKSLARMKENIAAVAPALIAALSPRDKAMIATCSWDMCMTTTAINYKEKGSALKWEVPSPVVVSASVPAPLLWKAPVAVKAATSTGVSFGSPWWGLPLPGAQTCDPLAMVDATFKSSAQSRRNVVS